MCRQSIFYHGTLRYPTIARQRRLSTRHEHSRQPLSSSLSSSQKPSKPSVGRQADTRQAGRQAGRQALTTAGRKAERLVAGTPHTQKPLMELAGSFPPALLLRSLFDARDFAKITYLVSIGRQKKKQRKTDDLFFFLL